MHMEVGEERALNAWIQRTSGTQDPVEQTMRQFLYRLSRSGVLDLQGELPGDVLQTAVLQPADLQTADRSEKVQKDHESATVGGVYNNRPHEHPWSPAGVQPLSGGNPPAGVQPPAGAQPPAKGWDTPSSPPSWSSSGSPSVGSAVFPPSRPPAWLSQESVASGEGVAPPQGDFPLKGAVPLPSDGDLPTAASLEEIVDAGEGGRLWVPQGVS